MSKLGVGYYATFLQGRNELVVHPPDEPLQLASNSSGELHDSIAARHTAQVRCCITLLVEGVQHCMFWSIRVAFAFAHL